MQEKLSDKVVGYLAQAIEQGQYVANERLPSERDLAHTLDVSRPLVREAIQNLRAKGVLYTRRGGGTYVGEPATNLADFSALHLNAANLDEMRLDILEVRSSLEEAAAYYAALRATEADHQRIRDCYEAMRALIDGEDLQALSKADLNFHLAIVQASHNVVLVHVMSGLYGVLRESIQSNLGYLYQKSKNKDPLNRQHQNLMEAVLAGNAEQARLAAKDHLVFVRESLER